MAIFRVLLLVSVVTIIHGAITVDTVNRKTASAACFRDTDTQILELNFYVDFGGNEVDKVLALTGDTFIRSADGTINADPTCIMSDITQGNVKITSKIDLQGSNNVNTCGARRVGTSNDHKWVIEVRALYNSNIYVGIDRRYFVTCSYDSAVSKYATTQLRVFGEDQREYATPINPLNSMAVLRQSVSDGPFLVIDTIQIGDQVKLRVATRVLATRTELDIYGLFPFSCYFGPLNKADRTNFIMSNGCRNQTNEFGLSRGFRYTDLSETEQAGYRSFNTETDTFVMVRDYPNYPSNDFYYLHCYVDYCFGANIGTDGRCTDYCNWSTTNGRKKRSVEMNPAELDQVTIAIKVVERQDDTGDDTDDSQGRTEERSSQLAVVIASCVATLIFFIILLIVVVMLCCRPGNRNHGDHLSESSSVSAKEHGPVAFVQPTRIPPKV